MTVTVPTWAWAVPVAVVFAGGLGWAAYSVLAGLISRAEAWALRRWHR